MVKTCKLCKAEKPIEEFARRFTHRDSQCKSCRAPTLRGGRPWIYPWGRESFTIAVKPGETPRDVQQRLCMRTAERKRLYGERWKTKQLWKAVKVTRLA